MYQCKFFVSEIKVTNKVLIINRNYGVCGAEIFQPQKTQKNTK